MFNYNGYNSYTQPQMPRYNPQYQPYNNQQIQSQMQQPAMQNYTPQAVQIQGLQGKTVDSVDVVKAMDIPLDGSVSYFPLVDGSAIVTKQLQQDGTSKTIIYTPNIEKKSSDPKPKYVTVEAKEYSQYFINDRLNTIEIIKHSKPLPVPYPNLKWKALKVVS